MDAKQRAKRTLIQAVVSLAVILVTKAATDGLIPVELAPALMALVAAAQNALEAFGVIDEVPPEPTEEVPARPVDDPWNLSAVDDEPGGGSLWQ